MPYPIAQAKPKSQIENQYRGILGLERRLVEIVDVYAKTHKRKLFSQRGPDRQKTYDDCMHTFKQLLAMINQIDMAGDLTQYDAGVVHLLNDLYENGPVGVKEEAALLFQEWSVIQEKYKTNQDNIQQAQRSLLYDDPIYLCILYEKAQNDIDIAKAQQLDPKAPLSQQERDQGRKIYQKNSDIKKMLRAYEDNPKDFHQQYPDFSAPFKSHDEIITDIYTHIDPFHDFDKQCTDTYGKDKSKWPPKELATFNDMKQENNRFYKVLKGFQQERGKLAKPKDKVQNECRALCEKHHGEVLAKFSQGKMPILGDNDGHCNGISRRIIEHLDNNLDASVQNIKANRELILARSYQGDERLVGVYLDQIIIDRSVSEYQVHQVLGSLKNRSRQDSSTQAPARGNLQRRDGQNYMGLTNLDGGIKAKDSARAKGSKLVQSLIKAAPKIVSSRYRQFYRLKNKDDKTSYGQYIADKLFKKVEPGSLESYVVGVYSKKEGHAMSVSFRTDGVIYSDSNTGVYYFKSESDFKNWFADYLDANYGKDGQIYDATDCFEFEHVTSINNHNLCRAASKGNLKIILSLLASTKSNLLFRDTKQRSALGLAIINHHYDVARELIGKGFQLDPNHAVDAKVIKSLDKRAHKSKKANSFLQLTQSKLFTVHPLSQKQATQSNQSKKKTSPSRKSKTEALHHVAKRPPNLSPVQMIDQKSTQLLSPLEIAKVKRYFKNNPKKDIYQPTSKIPYPVMNIEGKLYCCYANMDHIQATQENRERLKKIDNPTPPYPLGIGQEGIVVAMQSLEDNQWCAGKFQMFDKLDHRYKTALKELTMENEGLKTQNDVYQGSKMMDMNTHTLSVTAMKLGPGQDMNKSIVNDQGDNKLTLNQKVPLAYQLLSKAVPIAEQGFILTDFKSQNVMVDPETLELMIIDFGGVLTVNESGYIKPKTVPPKTPGYEAPEVLMGAFGVQAKEYSEKTLAFSVGMTLAELLTKQNLVKPVDDPTLFYDNHPLLTQAQGMAYTQVLGCFYDVLSDSPQQLLKQNVYEKELALVARQLTHVDPNQRMTLSIASKKLELIHRYWNQLESVKQGMASEDRSKLEKLISSTRSNDYFNAHIEQVIDFLDKLNDASVDQFKSLKSSHAKILQDDFKAQKQNLVTKTDRVLDLYQDDPLSVALVAASDKLKATQTQDDLSDVRLELYSLHFQCQLKAIANTLLQRATQLNRIDEHTGKSAWTLAQTITTELDSSTLNQQSLMRLSAKLQTLQQEVFNAAKSIRDVTQVESDKKEAISIIGGYKQVNSDLSFAIHSYSVAAPSVPPQVSSPKSDTLEASDKLSSGSPPIAVPDETKLGTLNGYLIDIQTKKDELRVIDESNFSVCMLKEDEISMLKHKLHELFRNSSSQVQAKFLAQTLPEDIHRILYKTISQKSKVSMGPTPYIMQFCKDCLKQPSDKSISDLIDIMELIHFHETRADAHSDQDWVIPSDINLKIISENLKQACLNRSDLTEPQASKLQQAYSQFERAFSTKLDAINSATFSQEDMNKLTKARPQSQNHAKAQLTVALAAMRAKQKETTLMGQVQPKEPMVDTNMRHEKVITKPK